MAKVKTAPQPPKAVTVKGVSASQWKKFKSKCAKANLSASERIRQLIADDIKV